MSVGRTTPSITHIKNTVHKLLLNNKISKIPYNYFEGCKRLDEVCLIKHELIAVPYLGFIRRTLRILDLSVNKIRNVSWLYASLPAVKSIVLGSNLIHTICMQPRSIWLSLSTINMNNNNLTSFYLQIWWSSGRLPKGQPVPLWWTTRLDQSMSPITRVWI